MIVMEVQLRDEKLLVNLEQVRVVRKIHNGAMIEFDSEHKVTVTGDYDELVASIKSRLDGR